MSELRTKKQTDISSEPERMTRFGRSVQIAPVLLCILLLTVSPVTAADAGLYEDTWIGVDSHHPLPTPTSSAQDSGQETTSENATLMPDPKESRDQQIIQYVEENKTADHGEGARQIRATVLRKIADLEDRGYDVTDLRSALESGDEEEVKNALSGISECVAGT